MTRKLSPAPLPLQPTSPEDDEPESTERPTVNPPFDVEAFARASDSKLRAALSTGSASRDAIDVVSAPEITEHTFEDPVAEMRERFAAEDYAGALELAELVLTADSGNIEAAECGEDCRTMLENALSSRLGSADRVPMVLVPPAQLRCLNVDHRAGFILSLIDGSSSVEMILDVCGMSKLDGLRIIDDLVQQKIVAFR
jgi:hypothetical protein